MRASLSLGLRSGEKMYINGAVIRVDRKVRIELLNDAVFFLEAHVMTPEQATTSLRRLYLLVQGVLMDPSMQQVLRPAIIASIQIIAREGLDKSAEEQMCCVTQFLDEGRYFLALKHVRSLIKRSEGQLGWASHESIGPVIEREEMR